MLAKFLKAQKGCNHDLVDFYAEFTNSNAGIAIPGVPKLDVKRMVDGGRTMIFLKPIPVTSLNRDFELQMKLADVQDKGKPGTVLQTETELIDTHSGEAYVRIINNNFYLGQGGWGGPRGITLVSVSYCHSRVVDLTDFCPV